MTLLGTALALAARKLHVFPCRPHDKRPATAHGVKDATTDRGKIERWWRTAHYNIAVATGEPSGIFVVDIDGLDAEAAMRLLEKRHGALPSTIESITPRGRHLFFQWPGGCDVRNSASKLAAGVDTRGSDGYVLVPPSVHPCGRRYYWSVDSAGAVAAAPAWLLTAIAEPPAATNGKPAIARASSSRASGKAPGTAPSPNWPATYCVGAPIRSSF